jgi:hypothetical protein
MATDPKFLQLRSAYDEAFAAFAREVRCSGAMIDAAESAYRVRRDALAAYLIRREVERIAHRLWVQSGCPLGTAERDWARAELQLPAGRQLLRCVA